VTARATELLLTWAVYGINTKPQFIHRVNGNGSKTAKNDKKGNITDYHIA